MKHEFIIKNIMKRSVGRLLVVLLFALALYNCNSNHFADRTVVTIVTTNDLHGQIDNFPRLEHSSNQREVRARSDCC